MLFLFVEVSTFTSAVIEYFGDDEGYRVFQDFLQKQPLAGSVMRGCGGLRKVRWSDPARKKGKRGGIRVIYLYLPESERFVLFDVYGKDEHDDLSPHQRNVLSRLAAQVRDRYAKGDPKK